MSLWPLFLNHQGRLVHKWTHYFPIYERHFTRFVNRPVTFIEIGCGEGGSLQMWKEFLGPLAKIVGIDIRPECSEFEEDQIHIRIGDQSNPSFLHSVVEEFGAPHVILDDGSHRMEDVRASFQCLYGHVVPDGVYVVEDLHTAYWAEFGGGLRQAGTFIEVSKDLIDELNAEHTRGALPETGFSRTTLSMHFYDSVIVFEKGAHGRKVALMRGGASAPEAKS